MEGVGGIADRGVGGWGRVAEAGVRLRLDCDALRLFGRGSGVLAWIKTSSCNESGVENRTVVKILGPFGA